MGKRKRHTVEGSLRNIEGIGSGRKLGDETGTRDKKRLGDEDWKR